MKNRQILDHLEWEKELPKLYSKELVLSLTFFFSVLFGAILYIHNLRAAGKWRSSVWIMLGAVAYHWLTIQILRLFFIPFFSTLLLNLIAGLLLTSPVWNLQFGRNFKYQSKSPIMPLAIAIILAIGLLFAKTMIGVSFQDLW